MLSILHTVKSTTAYKKKDGSVTGTGSTTLYMYGYGLISEKIGDITLYHHYNNLGSTMKLTDAKGTVKATYTYGTYGELLSGDAADALVYAILDKDYGMALVCVVGAAVPAGLRMFAKGAKCATTAARLMKTADLLSSSCSFLVNTRTFGENAFQMYDKYVVRGEELSGETVIEGISLVFSAIGMLQSAKGILDASIRGRRLTYVLCI